MIGYLKSSRLVFKYLDKGKVSLARINGVLGVEPRLETIVRSTKMVRTFFELLGCNDLEHIIC